MKYLIFFFLMCLCLFVQAQNYQVISYQKINETNGGFSGNLDNGDFFGVSIDDIGDLDGNGVHDLAVGAYTDDDGFGNAGAVWILFMDNQDQVISQTKISATSGGFTGDLDPDDRFGGAVAYLGDMNNDGLPELAVGADYDGDGGFWHGAVWILSLNPDGTVNQHVKISDTQGGFTGIINGDAIFGTDIANIGDLNNDGVEDLAVGSRRDADGGSRRGALWILFMNNDLTVNSFQKFSDTQGGFGATLTFEDYFGGSVANIGDLDGDGVNDLAVGSYRDDDGAVNSGAFYILFLNSNGSLKNYSKISNTRGMLNSTITNGALFGESIDGIVDIDQDGLPEIVVGAMFQQNPTLGTDTGSVFLIELDNLGNVSEEFEYTFGENCFLGTLENGDRFGGAVTFLPKADGTLAMAIGAYNDSENGNDQGAVWILNLGEETLLVQDIIEPVCNATNGQVILEGASQNTEYEINYFLDQQEFSVLVTADFQGILTWENLGPGEYSDITVTPSSGGCVNSVADFELGFLNAPVLESTVNPSCADGNGQLLFSGVVPNASYTISYELNNQPNSISISANPTGELLLSNLSEGDYTSFIILEEGNGCDYSFDDFTLVFSNTLAANLSVINSDTCQDFSGVLLFDGLLFNEQYVVSYSFNSDLVSISAASNGQGEILISNLANGDYTSIRITQESTSCFLDLGMGTIQNQGQNFDFSLTQFDPNNCFVENGSLQFEQLEPNANYMLRFEQNGVLVEKEIVADVEGGYLEANLSAGLYENINLINLETNCQSNLQSIELNCESDLPGCFSTKNFFTPNGDNINDFWQVETFTPDCVQSAQIFDRYGNLVVQLRRPDFRWDGTSKGNPVLAGDYWYAIFYIEDGVEKVYKTHFTLKR